MSEFYNKYKRLFNHNGINSDNRSQFLNLYKDISTPKVSFQSPQMPSKNGLKHMGRSPALDEVCLSTIVVPKRDLTSAQD